MKILQIIYSLAPGGAERFVVDLCNELAENKGDEIHLLTTNDDAIPGNRHYHDSLSNRVFYHNIGAKSGFGLKSIVGVYKTIKRLKPDVVHIHCSTVLIYIPSLLYKKAKYVQTLHSLANKAISYQCLKGIQKLLFKKQIQPITISNICQQSYVDFYRQSNAICINNGRARLNTTEDYDIVKKEITEYKQDKDIPVFIHVARFSKEKNQKLLFETFTRLHNNGKKFLLVVIGAGFDNSPYMHLNDTEYVKILGTKQNVGDYLACADYFVLSSSWEGLPISLLEAMSIGCIPISTPAGGVVDVIKNGENGYISPSFNSEDFYKTVCKSFNDTELIDKETIINDYKENYTIEVCASKYYNAYLNA